MTRSEDQQVQRLNAALVAVQVDLRATIPEWGDLQILVVPEESWNGFGVVAYVADRNGSYWSGGGPLSGSSSLWALVSVAGGTQDLLAEVHGVIWPTCPTHGWGVHVRAQGKGNSWDPDDMDLWSGAQPAWWCRGSGGHDLALVGRLQ